MYTYTRGIEQATVTMIMRATARVHLPCVPVALALGGPPRPGTLAPTADACLEAAVDFAFMFWRFVSWTCAMSLVACMSLRLRAEWLILASD